MSKKIAIIFDFDDTLAHDSTTDFLKSVGIDTQDFWKKRVDPLVEDGWDPIPAYLYMMIEGLEGRRLTLHAVREELERVQIEDPALLGHLEQDLADEVRALEAEEEVAELREESVARRPPALLGHEEREVLGGEEHGELRELARREVHE